jgi:Ni/Co efflux regulator RcnB
MRKLTAFLLLATAAPTVAAAQDDGTRAERRAARAAASEQSESRPERPSRAERGQESERRDVVRVREERRSESGGAEASVSATTRTEDVETIRNLRRTERLRDREAATGTEGASGGLAPRERRIRTIPETQVTATQPSTIERGGIDRRNRRDYRDGNYSRWSDNWRHDRRYDWRRHRDRHRSNFRIGFYYDPFGWNYRRWSIGSYLYPSYYRSSFWLNDPWQYRLPPAYGPYRWVRYWNDAFLVNIYTGEVVDVIHGFFW